MIKYLVCIILLQIIQYAFIILLQIIQYAINNVFLGLLRQIVKLIVACSSLGLFRMHFQVLQSRPVF